MLRNPSLNLLEVEADIFSDLEVREGIN